MILVRPLLIAVLAATGQPTTSRSSERAALPDTGLFAPVARQWVIDQEYLAGLSADVAGPLRIRAFLNCGRPEEAAQIAKALGVEHSKNQLARARAALAVQDFPAAELSIAAIAADGSSEARTLLYRWEYARDNAAGIDSLTRARLARRDAENVPELLAAGRVAYDLLNYPRADSLFSRALVAMSDGDDTDSYETDAAQSTAHVGRALVMQKRRQWDASLAELKLALAERATPEALETLANTLIRLGRTDEAISACEWGVRLDPYHDPSHYLLGNGYAHKNYTQLVAASPSSFAGAAGRKAIASADAQLAAGKRDAARASYAALVKAHPKWVDARIRLASLDFEDGHFDQARDGCFAALATCPEYGRAHAVLAKALESQRFAIDVHRPAYEARFAAAPMPSIPGIDKFVVNWRSLSPRHQKRVALSVAPWKSFVPVLVDGGATFYIKPMYMLLSECPDQQTLRDQRISYDSRLWDDVRGCGGYHTVTGIEDVERTIFDRYNTVTHELSHQVHQILPADDSRRIQELYRLAKVRDDSTHDGFLSRYAGGSVYEYFAEGVNSWVSPQRDTYDPREVVRERLDRMDPALKSLVQEYLARTNVSASYPVAYAAGGDDRVQNGKVTPALPFYEKALAKQPTNETALISYANALVLGGKASQAVKVATRAVKAHPASGPARLALADARWHAGVGLDSLRPALAAVRGQVRAEDRYQIDQTLGGYAWTAGDAAASLAAYDSVLAYQSDNPEGLRGRAAALALGGRLDEAFKLYDEAVRVRTGVVELRCDFARDLLEAGRNAEAVRQLDEAKLLDTENPTAEALRGWAALAQGDLEAADAHVRQALAWGPWCDLARIVQGGIARQRFDRAGAERAWKPVRDRIANHSPPAYVYRPKIAAWEHVHTFPAVERKLYLRWATKPSVPGW